jgi:hypothetical protein
MKKSLAVLTFVLILNAHVAFAHGNLEHVVGTVAGTSDHSITVKTRSGDVKEVEVSSKTKFVRGESTVTLRDVHEGDRVVIHARKLNDKLQAAEVQVGTGPSTAPARHAHE